MREEFLFISRELTRNRLIKLAESCPADKRIVIPVGFNNNVLWNLGHILTATDGVMYLFTGQNRQLPESYRGLFGNGTKPADWPEDMPAWDTIIAQLQEQSVQLRTDFGGKMDQAAVPENFTKAETVDELLQYALVHEANHIGVINAMLKLLV
jgi:uncharacterized damage-inducible protein DinB